MDVTELLLDLLRGALAGAGVFCALQAVAPVDLEERTRNYRGGATVFAAVFLGALVALA